jgi:hypothetical protein
MRVEEVYLELLPPLCRLARESGHGLIIKLHPFESLSQRRRIIRDILTPEDRKLVARPTADLGGSEPDGRVS